VLGFSNGDQLAFAEWMPRVLGVDFENALAEQVLSLEKGELGGAVELGGFWLADAKGFAKEAVGVQR